MSEKTRPTSRRGVLESFLTPRERKPRLVDAEKYPNDKLREAATLAKELQEPHTPPATPPDTPRLTSRDDLFHKNHDIAKQTSDPTPSPTKDVSNVGSKVGYNDPAVYPTSYPATSPATPPLTQPATSPTFDPTIDPAVYPTPYPASHPTVGSNFTEYPLTPKQREVLLFLYNKPQKLTSKSEIVSSTGISIETIKKIMQVLIKNKFIFKEGNRYTKGKFQGFKYNLNEELCKKVLYPTIDPALYPTSYPAHYIPHVLPDQRSGRLPHHIDDDIYMQKNHHLGDHDLADMFPKLFECGFRSEHLGQVIRAWNFKKLNLDELNDSLERAEWDVAHNGEIKSPCVYVLSAFKNGAYTAPPGFKLKRQLQAEESLRIARELHEMAEETIKARFDHWWNAQISTEEREQIDMEISKSNPALGKTGKFREIALLEYYRSKVLK